MSDHSDRIQITPDDVQRAPAVQPASASSDTGRPTPPPPPDTGGDGRCRRYPLPENSTSLHCPYALIPIRPGTMVAECAHCNLVHLEQSWIENDGCTTYGCQSGPTGNQAPAPAAPSYGHNTGRTVIPTREVTGEPVSMAAPIIQMVIGGACLVFPLITGLIGLVYAMKTNEHLAANNYAGAISSRRTAKIWLNIGWITIIGIVGLIVLLIAADA